MILKYNKMTQVIMKPNFQQEWSEKSDISGQLDEGLWQLNDEWFTS